MKKIVALILAVVIVLSFSSCASKDDGGNKNDSISSVKLSNLMDDMVKNLETNIAKNMIKKNVSSNEFKTEFVGGYGSENLKSFDIIEGCIYQNEFIPNDLIFGLIRVDDKVDIADLSNHPNEYLNLMIQVCVPYGKAIAVPYSNVVLVAMGTPNALDILTRAFNKTCEKFSLTDN